MGPMTDKDIFLNSGEEATANRQEADDTAYRGSILPFRETTSGELEWAMPQWMLDAYHAITLPKDVLDGHQPTTADIVNFGLTVGTGGVTASATGIIPEGAIGTFSGGKPKHFTPLYPEKEVAPEDLSFKGIKAPEDIDYAHGNEFRREMDRDRFANENYIPGDEDTLMLNAEGWNSPEVFAIQEQVSREQVQYDLETGWNSGAGWWDKVPSPSTTEFRSPIEDAIDHMDFPAKGSNIIKDLRERAPNIRKSELDTYPLDKLDPNKKYTREEVDQVFDQMNWDVKGYNEGAEYRAYQRQQIADGELDYAEFPIDAITGGEGRDFKPNSSHYSPETLAHTRLSLRQGPKKLDPEAQAREDVIHQQFVDGKIDADQYMNGIMQNPDHLKPESYVLIEELQSDLVQKGWKEDSKLDMDEWFKNLDGIENYGSYEDIDPTSLYHYGIDDAKAYAKDLYQQRFLQTVADRIGLEPSQYSLDVSQAIAGAYSRAGEKLKLWDKGNYRELRKDRGYDQIRGRMINLADEDAYVAADKLKAGGGKPPITSTTEGVRLGILQAIAYAQQKGVDKVVLPPLDRIIQPRMDGGVDFEKNMKPGSAFYNTYVSAANKVLNGLQNELGDKIKIGPRELKYKETNLIKSWRDDFEPVIDMDFEPAPDLEDGIFQQVPWEGEPAFDIPEKPQPNFTNMGVEIDISGLGKLDASKPRFADGGLIVRK